MRMPKHLRVTALLVLLAPLWALAACNTVEGLGQDVEDAGEAVDQGAETVTD